MKIAIGNNLVLLLTDNGRVYMWHGSRGVPTGIKFPLGIPIRYINAKYDIVTAIDYNDNVYFWGGTYDYISTKYIKSDSFLMEIKKPTILEYLTKKKVKKIYFGYECIFALTYSGNVYASGSNKIMLSDSILNDDGRALKKIKFPGNAVIKKLYVGDNHIFAIDITSKIYSWGSNSDYQLCNNHNEDLKNPTEASMLEYYDVKKIICLDSSTLILVGDKLYSIGYSEKLGLGINYRNKLMQIKKGINISIYKIWGAEQTIFFRMKNGELYVWGYNSVGQLGIGNNANYNVPVKFIMPEDFIKIYFHGGTTYSVSTDGSIYTWGKSYYSTHRYIPIKFTYFMDNGIDIFHTDTCK